MKVRKRAQSPQRGTNFTDRLFIRTSRKDNPADRVLKKLAEFNAKNRGDLIQALSRHKLLPTELCRIYKKDSYYQNISVAARISPENYIYWILGLLEGRKEVILNFNKLRDKFNSAVLSGSSTSALQALDDIEKLSACWWVYEQRVHVQKELLGLDTRDTIDEIERIIKPGQAVHKSRYLLLMSESHSVKHFTASIVRQLEERRSSGNSEAIFHGANLSCTLLPIFWDSDRILDLSNLYTSRNESLIDQYILLKSILIEMSAKDISIEHSINNKILSFAKLVGDAEIINTLDLSTPCEFVDSVIEKYTNGEYLDVLTDIEQSLNNQSPNIFGLIEIYSRAKIYCSDLSENTYYAKLSNLLYKILTLDENCSECINDIQRICLKFRNEPWARSLMFHLTSIMSEVNGDDLVELSRRHTKSLGGINTPKAHMADFTKVITSRYQLDRVPIQRAIRYGAATLTELHLHRSNFTIDSDFLKIQSSIFVENKDWLSAFDFLITEYVNKRNSYMHLPLKLLCKEAALLTKQSNDEFITSLIVLDIYKKEIGSAYAEEQADIFDDFLRFNKTHKPSEIFDTKSLSERNIYFLENICVPAHLDSIIQYKSNLSVIHERVTIIDLLVESKKCDPKPLNIEKHKLIESLFSDNLRTKIETGKLYVDIQALETQRKHAYKPLYDNAKSIDNIALDNIESVMSKGVSDDFFDIDKIEGVSVVISSNKKTDVLLRIYGQMARDFALDENFGLDKYLSAEIRHIVFSAQIRSCFEASNLMTTTKDGEYLTNQYWQHEYEYVTSVVMDEVDLLLKSFSKSVDEIIKSVNNQFRVGMNGKPDLYLFDYSAYHEHIVAVSKIVQESSSFEEFFRFLLDYMWTMCGEQAKDAQSLINDVLKVEINSKIDELESALTQARRGTKLDILHAELKKSKASFNKEVETVLNWFSFVGPHGEDNFQNLSVVMDAAVASFNSIYGHNELDITYGDCNSNLVLNFRESRALFISLFTALENAKKYKSFGGIKLEHRKSDNYDTIEITNKITTLSAPLEFISEQKNKWSDINSNLSREEGGSGLYKIYNMLSNASRGFIFDIGISNDNFAATMSLHNEYFASRR